MKLPSEHPDDVDDEDDTFLSSGGGKKVPKGSRIHPTTSDANSFASLDQVIDNTEDLGKFDSNEPSDLDVSSRYNVQAQTDSFNLDPNHKPVTTMTSSEKIEISAGLAYLIFTVVLSLCYLNHLSPSMSNDLWWAGFNSSGAQSYLIDVFNMQLNLGTNSTLDITGDVYGLTNDYSSYFTPIQVTPIFVRMYMANNKKDFATLITALRQTSGPERISVQYCWIDFNKTWEVAHTDKRQARCNKRYTDNAAMYWETIFRLISWKGWMKTNSKKFAYAMGDYLNSTKEGVLWMNRTADAFQSIEKEVAVWNDAGFTRFELQFTNAATWGIDETMYVENALGGRQSLSTKRIAYASRGSWTTLIMFWGPWNDFILYSTFIRSDPTHQRFSEPCNYTVYLMDPQAYACNPCDPYTNPEYWLCQSGVEEVLGLPWTPVMFLTQDYLGAFGSVDLFFIPQPPSLVELYREFATAVTSVMQSDDSFYQSITSIPTLPTDPVPPSWQNPDLMYFGGDPTCVTRNAMPFVQSSFAFDVTCTKQDRHTLVMDRFNTLFATLAVSALQPSYASSVCSACPTLSSSCEQVLNATLKLLPTISKVIDRQFATVAKETQANISKLQVSIIQYAIDVNTQGNVFLNQSILHDVATNWDKFSWIYLFEWAQALREVVSFEGDNGILVLISDRYAPIINEAQALEVPNSACQYLWVISVVVSSILTIVGGLFIGYSIHLRGRVVGRNLFRFNRIVGAVWLGRPFLLVRGMTAIIILSTSPLEFVSVHGFSKFVFTPRTFIQTLLVSGEAMWVSYVINDFLLLLTRNSQPHFAPMSTCIGWLIYVIVDLSSPYRATTTVQQSCSVDILASKLTCTSGSHRLGSLDRVQVYVLIQVGCILGSYLLMKLWQCIHRKSASPVNGHLLLSGTATAFLHRDTIANGAWIVDRASCVMCGLLTFNSYIFDLKLWLLVVDKTKFKVKWGMKLFLPPDLVTAQLVKHQSLKSTSSRTQVTRPASHKGPRTTITIRLFALAGLFYMCATIFGSVTYLSLTAINMANDFWWANYNISREHVFVARLFNNELVLRPKQGDVSLLDAKFLDTANYSESSPKAVNVLMKPLYPSQIQVANAANLAIAIAGLRNMDACRAPWIAAQYCWLDLNKKWEMANSLSRQARCLATYKTNGAVYLETVLRNVQWTKLHSCWGQSLEIGFHQYLAQSNAGSEWWNQVQAVTTSIPQEETVWKAAGIDEYLADWQNYKSVGLIDTFSIKNAFGFSYPMTLKHTNGTFTLASQTSMKMYWSLASDLWAITSPSTLLYGKSLVRNSPSFAFTNTSLEDVLVLNGTIQTWAIEYGGLAAFRVAIGPFGSVDLKRVAIPVSLVHFVTEFKDYILTRRIESMDYGDQFTNFTYTASISYLPYTWLYSTSLFSWGGNILCPEINGMWLSSGQWLLSGVSNACGSGVGEYLTVPTMSKLIAVIGANFTSSPLNSNRTKLVCQQVRTMTVSDCQRQLFSQPYEFLQNLTLMSPDALKRFVDLAQTAQNDLDQLKVELVQYASQEWSTANISIIRHNIFDSKAPEFHLVAWYLAYDLAMAFREVISIQGDVGQINIITAPNFEIGSMVNSLEIPVNVAYYIRYACLYVTCIIICVAFLAMLYLFANKGYVEGLNLFELNRVAGIVWIGRTFLFIRGLAAICLLSTQVLSLEPTNSLYHFVSATEIVGETQTDKAIRLFKTFLAAGEVSWLVFVLNDILMVFTAQYTTEYVFKCNFMVWGLSAILSLALPTTHTATMYRECEMPEVDFQLICTSGTIAIGNLVRFSVLIGICVISIALCYLFERLRHPHLAPPGDNSFFLAASAKYVYKPNHWIDQEIYYIDASSAVINGILSFRSKNTFFIFDLKIWRLFVIEEPNERRNQMKKDGEFHLLSAIPLSDK